MIKQSIFSIIVLLGLVTFNLGHKLDGQRLLLMERETPKLEGVEFYYISQTVTDSIPPLRRQPRYPKKKKIKKKKIRPIFKVVEHMPRFPGCEDVAGTDEEKKRCADKKMLEFIYKHLKYPEGQYGIEGQVVLQFIVEDDGSVTNVEILRDIGSGFGAEAKRVVEMMGEKGIKWTLGRSRGQVPRVQFIVPVWFKLNE